MKKLIYTVKLLLLALLIVACGKEGEDILPTNENYIILNASSSHITQTRVGFDDKGNAGVDVVWQRDAEHTDKFSIYNGAGNYVGDFIYIGTNNARTGQFIQTTEFTMADGTYTAVYPAVDGATYPTLTAHNNALYDLDVTTQTVNGSIAHLNESVRMRGQFTYSATATSPITFTFTQELVMATVTFVAPSDKIPSKLELRDGDYTSTLNISTTTSGSYKAYFLMRPNSGSRHLYFKLTNTNGTINRHVVETSTLYEAAHRYQTTIETFNEWIPIYDKDDLADVNNNLSGKYILINDIDIENDSEWKYIGYGGGTAGFFKGDFNGNGKKISNMTITGGLDLGFFGYCEDAEIYDLTLSNINITSSGWSVGALAGVIRRTKISNVVINNSNISGRYQVGGAIGLVQYGGTSYINNLTVNNSKATAQSYRVGGAIGGCATGVVINNLVVNSPTVTSTGGSHFIGGAMGNLLGSSEVSNAIVTNPTIKGDAALGGFCGRVDDNSKLSNIRVENPKVSVDENNRAYNVGGAVGELVNSEIENIEVISPTVTAAHQAGGAIGVLESSTLKGVYVETPNVTTDERTDTGGSPKGGAGGVIGSIVNSSKTVTVEDINCKAPVVKGKNRVGGVLGNLFVDNSSAVTYILRDITVDLPEVEGTIDVGGAIGLAQLNSTNTGITFNISNITVNAPKAYGENSVAGIAGATIDWGLNNQPHRILVSNLTATNVSIEATGTYIAGLIAYTEDAVLKNSKCIGGEVKANGRQVGGIVGRSIYTKIVGCYNSANISTQNIDAGGILGFAANNSEIIGCYNSGNIKSTSGSGGIIGGKGTEATTVKMIACYNTGNIMGGSSASGAMLGRSDVTSSPTITSCNWVDMPLDNATRALGYTMSITVNPISFGILNSKATVDAMNTAIAATGESIRYIVGAKSPELQL